MFNIFNSDQATLAVNVIVLLGFLGFLIYLILLILRKLKPEILKNGFAKNIETSNATQNIIAFSSVVLASTLFELFTDAKYRMMWVILIISITTIIFHIIYEKIAKTNLSIQRYKDYDEHLTLIEKTMHCKGYHLILNASKLETIEDRSDNIFVFTENLTTDIPKERISDKITSLENVGLFSNIVAHNIPNGKHYTYFLKNTSQNIEYIKEYYSFHFEGTNNENYRDNVNFYLVEENDFTFFTELYLYKDEEFNDMAFEWLPALGETNNPDKQFYLELNSHQVEDINEIIIELKTTCFFYNFIKYKKDIK